MQQEPLSFIKLDVSSRIGGGFQAQVHQKLVEVVLPDDRSVNQYTNQPINYLTLMKSGDCSDIGRNERQKILDSAEHHH